MSKSLSIFVLGATGCQRDNTTQGVVDYDELCKYIKVL